MHQIFGERSAADVRGRGFVPELLLVNHPFADHYLTKKIIRDI